jgi:hypothetical protein
MRHRSSGVDAVVTLFRHVSRLERDDAGLAATIGPDGARGLAGPRRAAGHQ